MKYLTFLNSCGYRSLRIASFYNEINFRYRVVNKKETSFKDFKDYFDSFDISTTSYMGRKIIGNAIYQVKYKGNNHFIYIINTYSKYSLVYDCSKIMPFCYLKNKNIEKVATGYIFKINNKISKKWLILKIMEIALLILVFFIIKKYIGVL